MAARIASSIPSSLLSPTSFISSSCDHILKSLRWIELLLTNESIRRSQVPSIWKAACVTPIPKSNDTSLITNYRPISILPVTSKVLEWIVRDQIMEHLHEYSLLSDRQSGFRSGHSTQDVLLYVTEKWKCAIDRNEFVGALFLDLSKAFDCVNHAILLSKLPYFGIRGKSFQCIQNYLDGRRQCTIVNGCSSDWAISAYGVPQGSILGPLLFSLYLNDLPIIAINSDISLYADDMEVDTTAPDLQSVVESLQKDLNVIRDWMSANKLKLNSDKCKCMLIGNCQKVGNKALLLRLNGEIIKQVTCVKYLGLLIDNHLSWVAQINSIIAKVNWRLASFRRIQPLPLEINRSLYKAFIYPYLDYCDCVWLPNKEQELSLEKLQKSFVRMVTRDSNSSYHELLDKLKLSTLKDQRKFHLGIQVFKSLFKLSPSYLFNIFTYGSQKSGHTLRNCHRLFIHSVRTNMGKATLRYRGAVLWNSLDEALHDCDTVSSFKSLYNVLYLNN